MLASPSHCFHHISIVSSYEMAQGIEMSILSANCWIVIQDATDFTILLHASSLLKINFKQQLLPQPYRHEIRSYVNRSDSLCMLTSSSKASKSSKGCQSLKALLVPHGNCLPCPWPPNYSVCILLGKVREMHEQSSATTHTVATTFRVIEKSFFHRRWMLHSNYEH